MYNKMYYKNQEITSLMYKDTSVLSSFGLANLFKTSDLGFWYDTTLDIKEKWRINRYVSTQDLTISPSKYSVSKSADGFLLTASEATITGYAILNNTYPYGLVLSDFIDTTIVRSVEFKKGTAKIFRFGGTADASAVFIDLDTLGITRNGGNIPYTITNIGDGWYRVETFDYGASFGTTSLSNFFGWGASHTTSLLDTIGQVGSTISLRKPSFAVVKGPSIIPVPYQEVISESNLFLKQHPNHHIFQDYAGTIPVIRAGQPVSLFLDKSKQLKRSSELCMDTGFNNPSYWTIGAGWSVNSSKATATATYSGIYINYILTVGKMYEVSVDLSVTSGSFILPYDGTALNSSVVTSGGTYKRIFKAGSGSFYAGRGSNFTGSIDNVSLKEIEGNHAYQPTSASRPMFRQTPVVGSNVLVNGDFTENTAGWLVEKASLTIVNSRAKLVANTFDGCSMSTPFNQLLGKTVEISLDFFNRTGSGSVILNIVSSGGLLSYVSSNEAEGKLSFIYTIPSNLVGGSIIVSLGGGTLNSVEVDNICVKEVLSYYSNKNYLEFDGVDDNLMTTPINFGSTNQISLLSANSKANTKLAFVYELGNNSSSNNGTFGLIVDSVKNRYVLSKRGNGTPREVSEAYVDDVLQPTVVAVVLDFTTKATTFRVNSASSTNTILDSGVAPLKSDSLYIGTRNTTGISYAGKLFSLLGVNRVITEAEITSAENLLKTTVVR